MANKLIPCGGFYFKDEQIQFEKTPNGQPLINIIGDGAGVTDYVGLTGKPQINGHELTSGDNTLDMLGIQEKGNYLQQGTKISANDITEVTNKKWMTDAEKSKLNGVATGANNYTLPQATSNVLGGVKKATTVAEISIEDAVAVSETYNKSEIDKIVNLSNNNKGQLNKVIQALKAAGIME